MAFDPKFISWKSINLPSIKITLSGHSRAAESTTFHIKECTYVYFETFIEQI